MADHHKAQSAKQTNEAAHQRRGVEPVHQAWTRLEQADQATLQRAVANPGLARPDDILGLQRAYGNQAITRLIQAFAPSTALGTGRTGGTGKLRVQAKLMVGPAGDQYEREADRVAEQVMSMPNPQAGSRQQAAVSGQPSIQREGEEGEGFQMKPLAASITPLVQQQGEEERVQSNMESRLAAHKGSGSPLPGDVRTFIDPRFGADFRGVRVHTGGKDVQMANELSAQAFTYGQDIYLGEGKYNPGSTEGRRLLAHELVHTIQQGAARVHRKSAGGIHGVIQRVELSADQIVERLSSIPFIRKQLAQHLALRRDPTKDPVMLDCVNGVLGQYETELRATHDVPTRHAMIVTVVLESVARVIAVNRLNDPGLTPHLTEKLLELYGGEIKKSLLDMDQQQEALRLAGALVSDDPVTLYMHGEMKKEEAVRRIREMTAKVPGKTANQMFDLLRQRFEIQIAPLRRTQVESRQAPGASYSIREATGEISLGYFTKLFGTAVAPGWEGAGAGRKLHFEPGGATRLNKLRNAVLAAPAPAAAAAAATPPAWAPGLTERQRQHLTKLWHKEQAIDRGNLDVMVKQELAHLLHISDPNAIKLREHIKSSLHTLPITINVRGADWFGKRAPRRKYREHIYRTGAGRKQKKSYAELFEKRRAKGSVHHLGLLPGGYSGEQDRTEDYWRFRYLKDMLMTGKLGFSDVELPKFGAVNIAQQARGSQSTDPAQYGRASYGDIHFVMKPIRLANQIIYTATDFGKPRTDIYLAFCDFLLGRGAIMPGKETKKANVVKMVINSLLTRQPVNWSGGQPFEVQIFGEVSMTDDIEEIWVAQTVPPKILRRVQYFARKKCGGKPVHQATPPPLIRGMAWLTTTGAADSFQTQLQSEINNLPAPPAAPLVAAPVPAGGPPP